MDSARRRKTAMRGKMLLLFSLSLIFLLSACLYAHLCISVRLIFGVVVLYLHSRRRIISFSLIHTHIHTNTRNNVPICIQYVVDPLTSTHSRTEKNMRLHSAWIALNKLLRHCALPNRYFSLFLDWTIRCENERRELKFYIFELIQIKVDAGANSSLLIIAK